MHSDIGEGILKFGVVVVRNRGEWIEEIWIHFPGLRFSFIFFLLSHFLTLLVVRNSNVANQEQNCWVESKMNLVVDATKSTQRISRHFIY